MIVRRHCEALSDTSRFFTERVVRPKLTGFDLKRTLGWAVVQEAELLLGDPPPLIVEICQQLTNRDRI